MTTSAGEEKKKLTHGAMRGALLAAVIEAMVAASCPAYGQQTSASVVAAPDFYAPTPTGSFAWVLPEEEAARDLADLLSRTPPSGFKVVQWNSVVRAETRVRWRSWDQLSFARLGGLAAALGADYLVLGQFRLFVIDFPGCERDNACGGNGPITATAIIRLGIYSRQAARIVATLPDTAGHAMGLVAPEVAQDVIMSALRNALPVLNHQLGSLGETRTGVHTSITP